MRVTSPGLFRLVLALVVVVCHSIPVSLGSTAVYIFFALSGYWIHALWMKTYRHAQHPYRVFLVSRAWRLLPVFYVAVALILAARYVIGREPVVPEQAPAAFYLSHVFLLGYAQLDAGKLLVPAWSLDVEAQFYLVAPLVVAAVCGWKLMRWALVLVAGAGLLRFFVGTNPTEGWLTDYLAFFLIGMFSSAYDWRPSRRLAMTAGTVGLLLIAALIALPATRSILVAGAHPGPLFWMNQQVSIILAFVFAPFAMYTVRQRGGQWDRDAGNISYVLYLVHWVGVYVVQSFYPLPMAQKLLALGAGWAAVGAVSWAIYAGIDRPLEKLRHAYVQRLTRAPANVRTQEAKRAFPGR